MPWRDRIAQVIPDSLYHLFVRREVTGFFYHVVSDQRLQHIVNLYPYKSPRQFEEDLLYVKQHYAPIAYEELLAYHTKGQRLRRGAALLSFDDGCAECYSVARQLLLKHGIPCIFFLTTNLIDNRGMLYRHILSLSIEQVSGFTDAQRESAYAAVNRVFGQAIHDLQDFIQWVKSIKTENQEMVAELCAVLNLEVKQYLKTHQPYLTSEQVQRLAADGFTIGAHSRSHSKFNTLTGGQIEDEIVSSCLDIQKFVRQESIPFAFPFSAHGVRREELGRIATRHALVGLMFDSKGFRKDGRLIYNRLWADLPDPTSEKSNLPKLIRAAYEEYLIWRLQRIIR